jgi:hypothetical protein
VVLSGSEDGIVASGEQLVSRALDLGAPPATGDGFGSSLAVGDFNNDGAADLAIGTPGDEVGSVIDAGSVTTILGSMETGLLAVTARVWNLASQGVPGAPARGDLFGWGLATGDFDADGFADLVAAIPGRDLGSAIDAGSVRVLYGSASGISDRAQRIDQAVEGVRGSPASGDLLGAL